MNRLAFVRSVLLGAAVLLPVSASAQPAAGPDDPFIRIHPGYATTLFWGSGLIDTPVAWVSPSSGDVAVRASVHGAGSLAHINTIDNVNLGGHVALFRRAEVGFSVFDGEAAALFGRAVLRSDDARGKLPGFAVGVRNVNLAGNHYRDRFTFQCDHDASVRYCEMDSPLTLYAVASDRLWLGPLSASWSLGWGNGLFLEVPELGVVGEDRKYYNSDAEPTGLFGGLRLSTPLPGAFDALHLVTEWNGWDLNTGLAVEGLGLEAGLFLTEAEHLGDERTGKYVYNFPKLSVNITARANVWTQGPLTRTRRVRQLEAEAAALEAVLRERQSRVQEMETLLSEGAQPGEVLQDLRVLRQTVEERIAEQEQEIRRLEAQLEILRAQTRSGGR